jgi:hypothetical protein
MTLKGTVSEGRMDKPAWSMSISTSRDAKGAVTKWAFETLGPGRMRAEGMSKQTFASQGRDAERLCSP